MMAVSLEAVARSRVGLILVISKTFPVVELAVHLESAARLLDRSHSHTNPSISPSMDPSILF